MERRRTTLEQRFGPPPDLGRLALISPNAWSDADRDAWERAENLHDVAAKDALIEKYSGHRPVRRPGVINVVVVPPPVAIEKASEDERRAWRERHER